ncbi:MAG: hypothetical protein R2860_14800 [Desulfobacterales bacterium]
MADAPADIDAAKSADFASYPVTFHTGTAITRIWKHSIDVYGSYLVNTKLFRHTLPSGRAAPSPAILYESGLTKGPDQWLNIDQTLQHALRIFSRPAISPDCRCPSASRRITPWTWEKPLLKISFACTKANPSPF